MHLIDSLIPIDRMPADDIPRARLLVHIGLFAIPVCVALLVYHRFGLDVPGWVTATELTILALAISVVALLRASASTQVSAACMAALGFASIALLSVLNGGFTLHVLVWALLIPIAVPAQWPRFFAVAIAACAAIMVSLYVLEHFGFAPEPMIAHSDTGTIIVRALSLIGVGIVIVLISRTRSGVTYTLAAERDSYQRAILQSQKLSSLGHLTGSLVHDFNNVLMSMDYARFLLSEAAPDNGDCREELDELDLAMERAKGLSRQLEAFGDDGGTAPPIINLDLCVAELETVATRISQIGVKVSIVPDARGAKVAIDPNRLDQILVNLVVNANDAMPDGGSLQVRTFRVGDRVAVEVTDSGTGIPDDVMERVFEPFYTTKSVGKGTGLGLWSCRTVAEEAGGELEVDTEMGRGTTMRLLLPIAGQSSTSSRSIKLALLDLPTQDAHSQSAATTSSTWTKVLSWAAGRVMEQRSKLWGQAIVALALLGALAWFAFGLLYTIGLGAHELALPLAAIVAAHLLVLPLLRWTGSVPIVLGAIVPLEFVGIGLLALSHGGYSTGNLVFVLTIPLVANLQKEYRHLVTVSVVLCVAFIAGFVALTITGAAPPRTIELTATGQLTMDLICALTALALFAFAVRIADRVDQTLGDQCEQFRGALLQSQKQEILGTFASSIAHDLNNVLMSLEFSTTLLDESFPEDHPSRADIEELQASCRRIRSLSKRLVLFGRDDQEGPVEMAIDHTLIGMRSMIAPLLGSHIEVVYALGASDAMIRIEPKRFELLVLNLLLNARDAMPDGGAITIATRSGERNVELDVTDEGHGIDGSLRERVFEPFVSGSETRSRTGLGLWMSRVIVSEAGGQVAVARTSAAGTSMSVTIPMCARRHRRTSPPAVNSGPAGVFEGAIA